MRRPAGEVKLPSYRAFRGRGPHGRLPSRIALRPIRATNCRKIGGLPPVTPHNEAKKGDYADAVLLPGDPLQGQMDRRDLFRGAAPGQCRAQLPGLHRHLEGQAGERAGDRHGPALARHLRHRASGRIRRQDGHPRRHRRGPQRQAQRPRHRHRLGRLDRQRHEPRRLRPLQLRASRRFRPAPGRGRDRGETRPHLARRRHRLVGRLLPPRRPHGLRRADAPTACSPSRWNRRRSIRSPPATGPGRLSICAISDNIVTGDKLKPEERQSSLTEMVELSLDVAVGA